MPALRPLFALALLAASGCTFGVDPVEVRGEDTLDAAGITLLREDLSSASDLRLTGIDEPRIRAALVTRGLLGPGQAEAAGESLLVSLYVEGTVARVTSWTQEPFSELLEPAWLELEVPRAMGVDLRLGSTHAHVSGVLGPVRLRGSTGSVVLEGGDALDIELDSGAIEAQARSARLRTVSGAMDLVIHEHVDAAARSGAIDVRLAGGGELHNDTGAITITLEGPLTHDLNVSTNDGAVHLRMAAGVGAHLDLEAAGGSVRVTAGPQELRGGAFAGDIGEAAHTIRVRTGNGSIAVDATEEGR